MSSSNTPSGEGLKKLSEKLKDFDMNSLSQEVKEKLGGLLCVCIKAYKNEPLEGAILSLKDNPHVQAMIESYISDILRTISLQEKVQSLELADKLATAISFLMKEDDSDKSDDSTKEYHRIREMLTLLVTLKEEIASFEKLLPQSRIDKRHTTKVRFIMDHVSQPTQGGAPFIDIQFGGLNVEESDYKEAEELLGQEYEEKVKAFEKQYNIVYNGRDTLTEPLSAELREEKNEYELYKGNLSYLNKIISYLELCNKDTISSLVKMINRIKDTNNNSGDYSIIRPLSSELENDLGITQEEWDKIIDRLIKYSGPLPQELENTPQRIQKFAESYSITPEIRKDVLVIYEMSTRRDALQYYLSLQKERKLGSDL